MGVIEKRTPHTRLSQVKKLVNTGQVHTTRNTLLNADKLGLDFGGVYNAIIGLSESGFYKSMTAYSDHTIWQDVYRPRLVTGRVHLKTTIIHDVLIVLFKEE